MTLHPLLTLLIPILIAIASWFVGSWLSEKRDRANKRRDIRVQYLIEAYRRLEAAGNRPLIPPYSSNLESAIADVQLCGSEPRVAIAQRFATQMSEPGQASLDELLTSLRNDLRSELHLELVEGKLTYLRTTFDSGKEKKSASSA